MKSASGLSHIWMKTVLVFVLLALPGCSGFDAVLVDRSTPVPGSQSIGDPYLPELGNNGFDVEQYDLRFTLDTLKWSASGEAVIQARSKLDHLGQISLDFVGFDIQKLTVDGSPAQYTREHSKLIITLPKLMNNGKAFSMDIVYSGQRARPANRDNITEYYGFMFEPSRKDVYTFGEPGGAEYWFPGNDHPRDKALYRFEITVPEGQIGVANGNLIDVKKGIANAFPDGKAGDRYTWEMKHPMSTYLAVVAAGDYALEEGKTPKGIPLRSYIYPFEKKNFDMLLNQDKIGEALDWMSEKFGPYPFGSFGYVMINNVNLSMETQSMILLGEKAMTDPNGGDVMVHEMVHMWFGDWVSLDSWADIWRNEGFATYFAALWEDQVHPGTLADRRSHWLEEMQKNPTRYPLDKPPFVAMFDMPSYYECALLVDDLRQEMGDTAFYQGLQAYFKTYGGKTASEEQFQAEMEKAAGKPLSSIFNKWFPAGLPASQ